MIALHVDFNGYGFPQFCDYGLPKEYGSKNVDEYISKALPMFSDSNFNVGGKTPVFFNGPYIPKEAGDSFFIVRIKTLFRIKKGEEAFVRYKGWDLWRTGKQIVTSDNHNVKDHGWVVLESTDIYNPKTGEKIADSEKDKKRAMVTLSLGKDDYYLFLSCYTIYYFELLDGCFFI